MGAAAALDERFSGVVQGCFISKAVNAGRAGGRAMLPLLAWIFRKAWGVVH